MVRGRLAPSPTGRLHLGHARTFLLAWAHVRSRGGSLVLRLEDLDAGRCRPEHVRGVLEDLEWLGLDWDGAPVLQSDRLPELREAAHALWRGGHAYPCFCSRADLRNALSAPQRGVDELRYPGTCSVLAKEDADLRAQPGTFALRFRVPHGHVAFVDGCAGPRDYDIAADSGDFVILNRAAVPSYQLAVVVDDAAQGVTEVLRGDDLLPSTPRQLALQRALGLPHPRWFHVPLVLDADGRRLAKRSDDVSLFALRSAGVDPRAVVAWVAETSGQGARERMLARELCAAFDLSKLPPAPVTLEKERVLALFAAR